MHGRPRSHCLVYKGGGSLTGGIDHLDTGKFEAFPRLIGHPIALSPDLETLVVSTSTFAVSERATTLTYCVLDLAAKTAVQWTVPRATSLWLERCPGSIGIDEFSDCLVQRGAHVAWSRGAAGRDTLVPPPASPETRSQPTPWGECASASSTAARPAASSP